MKENNFEILKRIEMTEKEIRARELEEKYFKEFLDKKQFEGNPRKELDRDNEYDKLCCEVSAYNGWVTARVLQEKKKQELMMIQQKMRNSDKKDIVLHDEDGPIKE